MSAHPMTIEILENDPLQEANLTTFYQQMKSTYETLSTVSYFTDIIKIIIIIFVILVDIFLIDILRCNSKLKTKVNQIILHYSVSHILFTICHTLVFDFIIVTGLILYLPSILFDILYFFQNFGLLLNYIFSFGLGMEWLCTVYNPYFGQHCKTINNYSIIMFYLIGAGLCGIQVGFMFTSYWYVESIIPKMIYLVCLMFILVCNLFQYKRRNIANKDTYVLSIANVLILFWVPLFIYDEFLMYWTYGSYILYTIALFTIDIPQWLTFITPIAVVIILRRHDEQFRRAIDRRSMWLLKNSDENSEEDDEQNNVTSDTNIFNV
ncbi:unnamed protein product [Psylliodes chrysocephalus]|uniref:Uncharacterized protein n=1 Tax=Psylliodes chrysocephalus TaxID=3402493 RepID=A0A9P0G9H8_9CUCU|nr:unnamed protein product [Psylliodes chrysocephala]